MKIKAITLLLVIISSVGSFAQEAVDEESTNSLTAECNFSPKYVWRGITYTDGFVAQPFISFTKSQFSIQMWGNLVGYDKNDIPGNEIDVYLYYNYAINDLTISPALFYYSYPGQEVNSTAEMSLGLAYSLGEFSVNASVAKDFVEAPSSVFGSLNLGYSTLLSEKFLLNVSTGIGYGSEQFNEYYIGLAKSALNYVNLTGSLSYSITENISVRPYFEYFLIADQELKDTLEGNTSNIGITIGIEF